MDVGLINAGDRGGSSVVHEEKVLTASFPLKPVEIIVEFAL